MYMMLVGSSPFRGKKYDNIINENKKGIVNLDNIQNLDLTIECRCILKKMLDPNPEKRISSSEVLESNWLQLFSG